MTRPAAVADVDAVTELERSSMGEEAWTRTQVVEELAAPGRVVQVAGAPPGALSGWVDLVVAGDTADLLRVAVHPDARRAGVARSLLDAGLGALPATVRHVVLEVGEHNVAARGLYTAYGFAEVARRRAYYRDGSDALVMTRPVGPHLAAGGGDA